MHQALNLLEVGQHVRLHMGALPKPFAAHLTPVRLLSHVNQLVPCHQARAIKHLPTKPAPQATFVAAKNGI